MLIQLLSPDPWFGRKGKRKGGKKTVMWFNPSLKLNDRDDWKVGEWEKKMECNRLKCEPIRD